MTLSIVYTRARAVATAADNPKRHAATLGASIDRFGYSEPVILDERTGRLISGHGRLAAVIEREEAGAEPPDGIHPGPDGWEIPVVRGWASRDDQEAEAALLALNRISERGGWKDQELADLLEGIATSGFEGTGYDEAQLTALLARLDANPGAGVEASRGERLARYTEKHTRSIVLDYGQAEFAVVVGLAQEARAAMHVKSNADLFLALLESDAHA